MAFRRFRRRKYNGMWVPVIQPATTTVLPVDDSGPNPDTIAIVAGSGPYNIETFAATAQAEGGLWAGLNQGLLIQRIVGKIHVAWIRDPLTTGDRWLSAIVKAGIYVDETDPLGLPQNNSGADRRLLFGSAATRLRWLWRRSWVVGEQYPAGTAAELNVAQWPASNSSYGSVVDGPNLDVKVKARVAYEQNLFLTIQTSGLEVQGTPEDPGHISYITDLRVLAKPIRSNPR